MTETEVEHIRALKNRTAEHLTSLDVGRYSYALEDTDERLLEYVEKIRNNPDDHNLYELLSVKRFFDMLDKYEWKPKRVQAFFLFYEWIKFSGVNGRTRYKLTPIQCFQFANLFGFWHEGHRLIRDAYLFVPRKFSKTTSAASLAVFDMLYGDNNAQAFVGANSFEQAKICFGEIKNIMQGIDPTGSTFQINREKIFYKNGKRDSVARCLTANAKTQDGLNASLVIMDEYSQARDTSGKNGADLKNVLTSSMGARVNPLCVVITTASEVIDGPFVHELEGVKKVLRGEAENDTMFASLFMPDPWDEEDDPHTWAKVQPHLSVTVQPNYYEMEYKRAQLSAENMLTFRTKLLNIFTINESKCWISPEFVKDVACCWNPLEGNHKAEGPATIAFDLSESGDLTAVASSLFNVKERKFYFHIKYFFAKGALKGHVNAKLYQQWADDGKLTLTDGPVIDYSVVFNYIMELAQHLDIKLIGYDQWKSRDVVNQLKAVSGSQRFLMPVGQTYANFTGVCQFFEHAIKTKAISIDLNPATIHAFMGAVLDSDKINNCKPMKRQHNGQDRIDGLIAMLMALKLQIDRQT